ncbi:phage baseplate plug family protein [Serratia marcescens]|uniref:phage baseplate plug family protein n=1 Tax=Serratia marcescens TaxID=615 RepID=UPI00374E584F
MNCQVARLLFRRLKVNLSLSQNGQGTFLSIPLSSGYAFQRFRVQLGSHYLVFRLRWLIRFHYFCVDIYENREPVVLGRALHPDVNLLAGLNTDIGKLYLRGESPTVGNLGVTNKLEWVANE